MAVEQICEVARRLVAEGFVCEEVDFELDPLWDQEPAGVVCGVCSSVLDILQFI